MWMPSSHVWVSPIAERTSSAPATARIAATTGQKRCRMVIPDPQDSNRRNRLCQFCNSAPEFGVHWDRRNFELFFASYHSDSQRESSPELHSQIGRAHV